MWLENFQLDINTIQKHTKLMNKNHYKRSYWTKNLHCNQQQMKSFLQQQQKKEDSLTQQEIKNAFNLYKCGNFCKSFALETEMHRTKKEE